MYWILFLLLLFLVILRFIVFHEYFEKRYQQREYERHYNEVLQEWESLPTIVLDVKEIFKRYGLISPLEYLAILLGENHYQFRIFKRYFLIIIKYSYSFLWKLVGRFKRNDSIRKKLREQIKVIDDEELIFAFR